MTKVNNLPSHISAEERAIMMQKAAEKRAMKREWAENNLKLDWADDNHWRELSSKYNYRLPKIHEKAASKFVNRFLKHFGLSKDFYTDVTGFPNGNKEAEKNPNLPAFAQIGFLLEAYDEERC